MIKQNTFIFRFLLFIGILSIFSCNTEKKTEKSILLYCAAGIRPAVEEISKEYEKEYGIRVDIQYGGSGSLLSNLRVAKQGDLYLAGDKSYIDEATKLGLVRETQALAFMKPVIAVAKGNPKEIRKIEDLFDKNIKVAIANPDAASIGRLTKKTLVKSGKWLQLKENLSVMMPTVNEVANSIKIGSVDAGIIWDATAKQYPEIDIVSAPLFDAKEKNITIGVLSYSAQATEALKFIRYLSAKDKGLPIFDKFGYRPIQGDVWKEKPEILFF
jgi:molybdate transport system substrate-binding protein